MFSTQQLFVEWVGGWVGGERGEKHTVGVSYYSPWVGGWGGWMVLPEGAAVPWEAVNQELGLTPRLLHGRAVHGMSKWVGGWVR